MSILLKNISKIYEDGEEIISVLKDVNISIKENEFIGIIGITGSGKSTLLNIIGGIDEPSIGEYIFNNVDIKKNKELNKFRNRNFGYIFNGINLINDISVYKNIRIPLEYSGLNKKEIKSKVDFIINTFKLSDEIDKLPSELSIRQYQKVVIARAIVNDPSIILVDEPTSFLYKENRDMIIDILKDLHSKGKTIIVATQDSKLIKCCTRVIEIEDGIVLDDYVNEV